MTALVFLTFAIPAAVALYAIASTVIPNLNRIADALGGRTV